MRWGAGDRSAPLAGGDLWQDCQEMWRGKNVTFNWQLMGERTVLAMFRSTKKNTAKILSNGAMSYLTSPMRFGYEVKGWTGAPWVPMDLLYVPRQVWVVKGTPKDPYYNYGPTTYYIDKENYGIWLMEVMDKAGNPWLWQWRAEEYCEAPNGMNNIGASEFSCIIDVKAKHATLGKNMPGIAKLLFIPAKEYGLEHFNTTEMLESTKK
jgi:hypothetical protein